MIDVITDNTDTLYAALREIDRLRAENDAIKAQRGEAVCIGEVRDVGVVWFKDNPHAHAIGTRFYTTPPATDALVEALEREFPLFDDEGLDEIKHHCEWALLQDRKRLHQLLATYRASQRKEG